MELLDMKCAECGVRIASAKGNTGADSDKLDKKEVLLRNGLGILQENGVYAFFLYLATEKEPAKQIQQEAFLFLKKNVLSELTGTGGEEPLAVIRQKLSDKLDDLLLAKELLERVLVYALYHARAAAEADS